MCNSILKAKILLNVVRTGWLLRGVPIPLAETVAEHSFLTAHVCLELSSKIKGVDVSKAILYSLIHDLGEAFTGDLVKPIMKKYAQLIDQLVLDIVSENIDNPLIVELYRRFSLQTDVEAKLAKLCNYIATVIIGAEYKSLGYEVDDIIANTCGEIKEISTVLGVEKEVKHLLSELQVNCPS